MKPDSLEQWHKRIGRAAELLSARLDDPPSLDELAAAAAVSPFHFHRIWRALAGETVGMTLTRLRIEASKQYLVGGAAPVTAAAMAAGYATPQSYARAFRAQTGISPSAFARGGSVVTTLPDAEIRLELRDSVKVVALRRVGGAYTALNAWFGQVWNWAESAGLTERMLGIYGIPLDDPASIAEDALRYDACFAFGDVPEPPAPFAIAMLPSGPHAVMRHHGSYDGLEDADQQLIGDWLLQSGREPADAPLYHHFHNDPEHTPEAELITDILLPLKLEGNQ
jgi:AraC family transcriptional regulator